MSSETLAHKLGMTTHRSALLMKARGMGLHCMNGLCALTVQRGCRHYWQNSMPVVADPGLGRFGNEELAIALLTVAAPYDPHVIRCGAAMLGADGNEPARLAKLAVQERCTDVVRYVAESGSKFEPENMFWTTLLTFLPPPRPLPPGILPHPTRFVAMNGYERGVGRKLTLEWQRPQLIPDA